MPSCLPPRRHTLPPWWRLQGYSLKLSVPPSSSLSFLSWSASMQERRPGPCSPGPSPGGPVWPCSLWGEGLAQRLSTWSGLRLHSPHYALPAQSHRMPHLPRPYLPHGGPCPSLLCASLVTQATFAETLQVLLNSQEPPDWRGSVLPYPSHRPAAQLHPQSPPCARSLALLSFRGWGSIWSQLRLLPLPHPASRLQVP